MSRRRRLPLLVVGALLALPSTALAQGADVEGVWSFTGGQVAVQAEGAGFVGTIIRPTRFSACTHQNGERMWTSVVAQPDGQYFGKHNWFDTSTCTFLPTLGNIALRVLARPDGAKFLRVCFARPESASVQPSIAPDGTSTNVEAGCNDSDLLAALPPGTPKITQITRQLPTTRRCRSKRSFTIRLKEPRGDALNTATVSVNGRRVATRRADRITAPINLTGLPRGRYTVKITARTVLGKTITGTRKYRTCAPKRRSRSGSRV